MSIQTKLRDVAALSVQKDKANGYLAILDDVFKKIGSKPDLSETVADIKTLLTSVVNEGHAGPVVARQVLIELVKELKDGRVKDNETRKEVLQVALDITQPRGVSFDEQVRSIPLL